MLIGQDISGHRARLGIGQGGVKLVSGVDWGGGQKFKLVENLRWPGWSGSSWDTASPSLLKTFQYGQTEQQ